MSHVPHSLRYLPLAFLPTRVLDVGNDSRSDNFLCDSADIQSVPSLSYPSLGPTYLLPYLVSDPYNASAVTAPPADPQRHCLDHTETACPLSPDTLCILQHEKDGRREAAAISFVSQDYFLVISAAKSPDPCEGL